MDQGAGGEEEQDWGGARDARGVVGGQDEFRVAAAAAEEVMMLYTLPWNRASSGRRGGGVVSLFYSARFL